MKNKKQDKLNQILFTSGLIIYFIGLLLLICTVIYHYNYNLPVIKESIIVTLKIVGIILFIIGFIIFMTSIIKMYQQDNIIEKKHELIIEGKADVITIMLMTYILIFMLVLCLILDQIIGALLFGLTVLIQSITNIALIKYFSRGKDKKI